MEGNGLHLLALKPNHRSFGNYSVHKVFCRGSTPFMENKRACVKEISRTANRLCHSLEFFCLGADLPVKLLKLMEKEVSSSTSQSSTPKIQGQRKNKLLALSTKRQRKRKIGENQDGNDGRYGFQVTWCKELGKEGASHSYHRLGQLPIYFICSRLCLTSISIVADCWDQRMWSCSVVPK